MSKIFNYLYDREEGLPDLYDKLCDDYGCLKEELEEAKRENGLLLDRIAALEDSLRLLFRSNNV